MLPYNITDSQGFLPMPSSNKKRKTGKIQHQDTFVYTLLQNIYSQQGDRHIYVVYKIKENREREGKHTYSHLEKRRSVIYSTRYKGIRMKRNKVGETERRKQGERKGSERISCVRGEECGGEGS